MVAPSDPVTIKLYAQRRFFWPCTASYMTFDDLLGLVHRGVHVVIKDAKTGADVTAFVLSETPTEH